ncbi:zinc finger protein 567-like [Cylas formicarius]|uniref:zinc finger protein 567-like n=1 Tax=Cylas formicarius TaxID=197179 RepID=UPI002958A5A0|nr:zinc finger protein 567-like [Cylas formicarius]XP_060524751.1 zinc finger protein 567-like [Cylas formicarius]
MEVINIICPVCTLYLRPGITLKQHLTSHPKQKVIDALVKLAGTDELQKLPSSSREGESSNTFHHSSVSSNLNQLPVGHSSNMSPFPGNHVFIYQQSMSTTSPHQSNVLNMNPLNQQYLVPAPAYFNSQMMPYVYQQQQVIMSSNTIPANIRALPFELPGSSQINEVTEQHCPQETSNDGHAKSQIEKAADTIDAVEVSSDDDLIQEMEHSSQEDGNESIKDDEEVPKIQIDENDYEKKSSDFESKDLSSLSSDSLASFNESHSEYEHNQEIDHEECVGTPYSQHNSDWSLNQELDKACQTQAVVNLSPKSVHGQNQGNDAEVPQDGTEFIYFNQQNDVSVSFTSIDLGSGSYEQAEPIYTSVNILHGNDPVDFVTMEDIDGMQVIINDFNTSPIVPQADTIEHERPRILMTLGEMTSNNSEENSVPNVNIESDEKMPPRGELSGQESMGSASDIVWNTTYQSQVTNNEYNNLWEDSYSLHAGPLRENRPEDIDKKTTVVVEDRSVPQDEQQCDDRKANIIGLDVGRNRVKKLVIRPKKPNTFNNVFTNRLKVEQLERNDENAECNIIGQGAKHSLEDIKIDETLPAVSIVCQLCTITFSDRKMLKLHAIQAHNILKSKKEKYLCAICNEQFANEYEFTVHLKVHPLECRMCGKLFYRRQNLKLHMKRHLGLKPFQCDMCDKSFVTKQKVEEHRNTHTGNCPYKCHMCDDTFKRHSNLIQHRNRHHLQIKKKLKDYICSCGEIFHSKKKLAWHQETHDQKPKACTHCSEKFIHTASLNRHMKRAHNVDCSKDQMTAICPICKGSFLKSSLDAHIRNHSGQRPFTCLICNKDFTTKWNLKLHKWTHASRTQKPFKCNLCKAAFIRNTDYVAHMNSHKNVRPYTCNYCGAQFIRKYNCLRHVKEHENDKTYNCSVCGKSFHRSYYLKDHMRVHSGVRPFACHICGKTSTTKSNHNKHVQIHHAREPVSTEN